MTMFILFGVYVLAMIYLLFLQRLKYHFSGLSYSEYISSSINLIPFRTITEYAKSTIASSDVLNYAFVNLSGNILMFVPFGFFLPTLWRKQRKISRFAATVCITVAAIELIQLFTTLGSCDVDDFIFNIIGAALGFGIWKLKPVLKFMHKYGLI
jgi:glycopeptide antibiotics resistance protein